MITLFRCPPGLWLVLAISLVILYHEHQAAIPHTLFGMPLQQSGGPSPAFAGSESLTATFTQQSGQKYRLIGESAPLSLHGDAGYNIRAALDANGGALRSVIINPGDTWSFNASVGAPTRVRVRVVAGIPGGGWCDLASRYVQALRPVLPPSAFAFPNHVQTAGIGLLNVADEDAVAIWNIDGQAGSFGGRQDLQITNTHAATLQLHVVEGPAPDQIVVRALEVR
ncbi:MAG: hypothetical protein HXY39_19610 [Chloroflexi bacterium]|nr:hypothetical protein [Chloroflexota bacterium]